MLFALSRIRSYYGLIRLEGIVATRSMSLLRFRLGFERSESRPQLQLIRAELSSKSYRSILRTFLLTWTLILSLGFLCVLRREPVPFVAPLQLKGCTRFPFLSSSTTPSGASGLQEFFCACALHFDLGVEQAWFRRSEGSSSLPIPGLSPSGSSSRSS